MGEQTIQGVETYWSVTKHALVIGKITYRDMYIKDQVLPTIGRMKMIDRNQGDVILGDQACFRTAGCSISRKVVNSVGNGVLQAKCPEEMGRNGGKITLSVKWAR